MDFASVFGTVLGVLALLLGQVLEGGHLGQIAQGTAALIVLGGTLGAVLVSFPPTDLKLALHMLPLVYRKVVFEPEPLIKEIVEVANVIRREGLLAVESTRGAIKNEIFKKSIKHVSDGLDPAMIRDIMDAEIDAQLEREESAAAVFEAAGGYAPTIGILAAVLGLIHVLSQLSDPSKLGTGIAVAFVATVYGVALANLILLPWGSKLRRQATQRLIAREVVREGILGILEGINPHFLQEKLNVFAVQAIEEKREQQQAKTA